MYIIEQIKITCQPIRINVLSTTHVKMKELLL